MKRKNPSTSLDAYKQVTEEMLTGHYKKIVNGLKQLGTANADTIAKHIGLDTIQVSRRLIELERMEIVYKPGTVSLTKSKRKAFNYCLTGKGMPIVQAKEEKPKKQKPVIGKQMSFEEIFGL